MDAWHRVPRKKATQPAGADHYTCYPTTYTGAGTYSPPSPVQVADQFTPANSTTTVTVGNPEELCVPTEKILPSGKSYQINNPTVKLSVFRRQCHSGREPRLRRKPVRSREAGHPADAVVVPAVDGELRWRELIAVVALAPSQGDLPADGEADVRPPVIGPPETTAH